MQLNDTAIIQLAKAVHQSGHIFLDLSDNMIGDEGLKALFPCSDPCSRVAQNLSINLKGNVVESLGFDSFRLEL